MNFGQLVSGFKAEPSPEMGMIALVQIDALIAGALNADGFDLLSGQSCPQPAGQILVSRHRQIIIEQRVIERGNRLTQPFRQRLTVSRPRFATVRQCRPHPCQKAVAVQTARTVTQWQDVNPAGGFKRRSRKQIEPFGHGVNGRKRSTSGSASPASAKPLARSTQAGQCPQGGC